MDQEVANLLGAVGLAVADGIEDTARAVLGHVGATPAALVVIGYGTGPSNERLRRVLRLSHPGAVRLVDRLVADGLVERRAGPDKRAIALHLTDKGAVLREELLRGRLAATGAMLSPLSEAENATLAGLLRKMLSGMGTSDELRRTLCRLCDDRVCRDCPIPADKPAPAMGSTR